MRNEQVEDVEAQICFLSHLEKFTVIIAKTLYARKYFMCVKNSMILSFYQYKILSSVSSAKKTNRLQWILQVLSN